MIHNVFKFLEKIKLLLDVVEMMVNGIRQFTQWISYEKNKEYEFMDDELEENNPEEK